MMQKIWSKPLAKSLVVFLSLFVLALLFYFDAFSHFFYQDDLFHFHISKVNSLQDFLAFFNPINRFGYQIYRPLGTQLVFWIFGGLFGLNHTLFQLFIILLLSCNAFLIYQILGKHTTSLIAFLLSVFYLVHHQNIGIIYFLSTVQLSLALFFTLISIRILQNKVKFWQLKICLLYLITILCQEISLLNSLIFPLLLFIEQPKQIKNHFKLILALSLSTLAYLAFRFYFINQQIFANNHYEVSLSPSSILNNLTWYGLWMLSVPEYVINFVGSGLRPLPPLFGQYRVESIFSLIILLLSAVIFLVLIWLAYKDKTTKSANRNKAFLYLFGFALSLAPVLVFPWHKYVYHLPIASVFVLLFVANLLGQRKGKLALALIIGLIIMAIMGNLIDRQNSYNYKRGNTAQKFKKNVDWSMLNSGAKTILVANDPTFEVFAADWGSTSTQAKIVLKENLFFTLQSGNEQIVVIYEDDLIANPANAAQLEYDYQIVAKKEW